ncbi:unnamed protein product [Sphenostylis stenocarpa]|uniref:Uncharacterized protein n=1 Tax=Sphenostylis stenocarpa TaxID=92480 RepID=A0AA86S0I7_9FABA|nr:unnamed protein product [Sphenostylis stenocarpa]
MELKNRDGGWGFHIKGHSTMFGSALSYIALRILGEGREDGEDRAMARGRKWILDHGGLEAIPSWGKFWATILGVYEWSGCNPLPPEIWLLPKYTPIHPDMLWASLHHIVEPLLNRWPFSMLREKALKVAMDHIRYEDENSRFLCIGSIEKALRLIARWVEDPNSESYKLHLARIPDYFWLAEDGLKIQSSGCQLWDAALAIQAILSCDLSEEYGPTLQIAHHFVKASQVRESPSGDFEAMHRHISKGAWTFSMQDQGWQVSDCIAEGLKAALLLSQMPVDRVGEKMEDDRFYDAVNVILSLQVNNGGFPAWEPQRAYRWIEKLNPTEISEDILVEME